MKNKECIFIIDDDPSVRRGLSLFLEASGYQVESFPGSEGFLELKELPDSGCIILDINLGGRSGLELQEELIQAGCHIPIIFITGYGDIPTTVRTLKKGAINFLTKPFRNDELLGSVEEALRLCRTLNLERTESKEARDLINTLTPRELEILKYLFTGMLNKQIASELSIAERTVKLHKHHICEKLGVPSVAEILRIADKAGIRPT